MNDEPAADLPLTLGTVVLCPSCRANFQPSEENFVAYMSSGRLLRCPSCEASVDWWDLIRDATTSGFLGLQYVAVRAQLTVTHGGCASATRRLDALTFKQGRGAQPGCRPGQSRSRLRAERSMNRVLTRRSGK